MKQARAKQGACQSHSPSRREPEGVAFQTDVTILESANASDPDCVEHLQESIVADLVFRKSRGKTRSVSAAQALSMAEQMASWSGSIHHKPNGEGVLCCLLCVASDSQPFGPP
ncbi:hypothetical protein VTK26DRAFT_7250 [Humicola hyalothermophila]